MTNSEKLMELIDSFYGCKLPRDVWLSKHAEVITKYSGWWNNIKYLVPKEGTRVFAIQDLTPIGKGMFVGDYWYQECGFVANEYDDDAYGFITHWIDFDTVNAL